MSGISAGELQGGQKDVLSTEEERNKSTVGEEVGCSEDQWVTS